MTLKCNASPLVLKRNSQIYNFKDQPLLFSLFLGFGFGTLAVTYSVHSGKGSSTTKTLNIMEYLKENIFSISPDIRYVAIYANGKLISSEGRA
jgi:hypothetical protein